MVIKVATYTFGKQKAHIPTMFAVVDQAIQDFIRKITRNVEIKGAGAGGGIADGFVPLLRQISCLELIPA